MSCAADEVITNGYHHDNHQSESAITERGEKLSLGSTVTLNDAERNSRTRSLCAHTGP